VTLNPHKKLKIEVLKISKGNEKAAILSFHHLGFWWCWLSKGTWLSSIDPNNLEFKSTGYFIQAYLGYCVTPSNYGLYPRINNWQIMSRKDVGPGALAWCRLQNHHHETSWHDNSVDNDNVLF
jgi:hypothetical protein